MRKDSDSSRSLHESFSKQLSAAGVSAAKLWQIDCHCLFRDGLGSSLQHLDNPLGHGEAQADSAIED